MIIIAAQTQDKQQRENTIRIIKKNANLGPWEFSYDDPFYIVSSPIGFSTIGVVVELEMLKDVKMLRFMSFMFIYDLDLKFTINVFIWLNVANHHHDYSIWISKFTFS